MKTIMKKLLLVCSLTVGLASALPVLAFLPGLSGFSVSAAEATPETDPAPVPVTGWQKDATGFYYLENGVKAVGWRTIGGLRYYFKSNGYRVSGTYKVGSKYYLFRPETESKNPGALCTGKSGLVAFKSNPNVYYYLTSKKKGIVYTSRWVKKSGKYYYANAKGVIKLGTIKVNKKRYHITKNGRMTFYGKSSFDGKYYYAGANGILKTGFQKINNKLYYFDKKTGARASGVVKVGNYTYYFKNTGAKTGWVKKSKGTKVYYYDSNGRRASGWYTIKNKKYYFDPQNDDIRVQNCWKKINKKYYYFNASGVLQTGFITISGKTYYANANGVRKKGWQKVNGRKYYMDPKTFVMQTGWLTYNKKTYYLNPTKKSSSYGAATTGWVNAIPKNGKKKYWYYFNNDGTMHTGWLTESGKKYYFNPSNGQMLTGKQTIDGKTYNFSSNGVLQAATPTGAWRIEVNRSSCFVVVYRGDTEMRAFVCSTAANGVNTPTGTFTLLDKLRWHELNGPTWGQYCSHITWNILFHSVPNTRYNDNHSLEAEEYNKLGTRASGGCIRLTVEHAKYLYDNCPIGTKVIISDSVARPKNVTIEQAKKIPVTQNYDPTDPYA